jgi:spermidine/putrescine-binding protein
MIFDPEQGAANAGKISFLDDARETLGAALIWLGYSINTTNQAELDEAAEVISKASVNVATYSSAGYWDLLTAGDTDVAMGWPGDFTTGFEEYNLTEPEVDAYDQWGYAYPVEGVAAWIDTMAIPHNAEHPCTAHAYINMVLDAEMGAELTHYNYYASPNAASTEFIDPEVLADPFVFPPQELIDSGKLEFFLDVGDFTTNYIDAFAKAKG